MQSKRLTVQAQLAVDALRRYYPQVSIRRLADYLCEMHKGVFTSFSQARDLLRWYAGVHANGLGVKHPNPVNSGIALMPPAHYVPREDFILTKGRYGILPDVHVPFHAAKPIEVALDWFRDEKITGIILSDAQDCSAISYWPATGKRDFPEEVESMIDFLDMLRANFPKASIIWQRGNHEDRLEQYYRAFAPQLADLPTSDMETTLCLAKRKITLLARKQKIQLHKLAILHGHEMKGSFSVVSPSRWAMLKARACIAVAHFHQTSQTTQNDIEGTILTAFSFGCLCDLKPDYNPFGNSWNWGAAVLSYDGHEWEMDNRRILPNGRLVT
jgi:predicted phosphodiesterase